MSKVIELEAYRIKKQTEAPNADRKESIDATEAFNKMFEDALDNFPAPKKPEDEYSKPI